MNFITWRQFRYLRTLMLVFGLLLSAALVPAENLFAQVHSPHAENSAKRLWCNEHELFEDQCFICHPELREKGRLWCNEHERYEDRCWVCHPELADKNRPYCTKHFLYLDECTHLHPENRKDKPRKKTISSTAEKRAELFCKEHDLPELECGICHPELLASLTIGKSLKVRLPAKESSKLIGLTTQRPKSAPVKESLSCLGELKFNQNKTAHIVAPVRGVIKKVHVELGQRVVEGAELVSMWSPAIAESASEALLAAQTLERAQRLRKKTINSTKDLEQAEAVNRAAVQNLQSLGFSAEQIKAIGEEPEAPVMLNITAPFGGTVVDRDSVQGEFVEPGASLFTVTDQSLMWAMLSVPESELGSVAIGQAVLLRSASFPGEVFKGTLSWVSASVDPKTRMTKARADVQNASGQLRDNMFVEAEIVRRTNQAGLLVPKDAVQKIEDSEVVFVKIEEDLYEVRPVKTGVRTATEVEVLSGLSENQEVVSSRSYALKSQFLISRLGVGCVH